LTITELMINEQIRDKEIRLIDENGEQLGIVSSREAQKIADERKLDLVKIAPTAKPPVCRIMDYGKYKFDQAKKEKEARKKQKTVDVKELRLSPSIDTHDVQVKVKKANEFLKDGDKVKISIRFRGREIGHSKVGILQRQQRNSARWISSRRWRARAWLCSLHQRTDPQRRKETITKHF